MFSQHPYAALALAHERGRQLREVAAVERHLSRAARRRSPAASLRRVVNRLDPVPLAHRSV